MTTTAEKSAVDEKIGEKRKALGRGLDSLLPSGPRPVTQPTAARPVPEAGAHAGVIPEIQASRTPTGDAVLEIALDAIDTNPYQTRSPRNLDEEKETGGGTLAE